jgi:hypothetical protein
MADRLHRIAELRPLSFAFDTAGLDVGTVHVFDTATSIALSFLTARGAINRYPRLGPATPHGPVRRRRPCRLKRRRKQPDSSAHALPIPQ